MSSYRRISKREAAQELIRQLEKIPPENAGEFSPDTLVDLLDVSPTYAREIFAEYMEEKRKRLFSANSHEKDDPANPWEAMRCRSNHDRR